MSDSPNLSDIKKILLELGISVSTPGLVGEDRYRELLNRWQAAKPVKETIDWSDDNPLIQAIKNLSLSEVRVRLTELGISTSTPGLVGEDRWNALTQRLIASINDESKQSKSSTKREENSLSGTKLNNIISPVTNRKPVR